MIKIIDLEQELIQVRRMCLDRTTFENPIIFRISPEGVLHHFLFFKSFFWMFFQLVKKHTLIQINANRDMNILI